MIAQVNLDQLNHDLTLDVWHGDLRHAYINQNPKLKFYVLREHLLDEIWFRRQK